MIYRVVKGTFVVPPIFPYSKTTAKEFIKGIFPDRAVRVEKRTMFHRAEDYFLATVRHDDRRLYYFFIKDEPTLIAEPLNFKKLNDDEIDHIAKAPDTGAINYIKKVHYGLYQDSGRYDYRYKVNREAFLITPDWLDSDELLAVYREYAKATARPDETQSLTYLQTYETDITKKEAVLTYLRDSYPFVHYIEVIRRVKGSETLLFIDNFAYYYFDEDNFFIKRIFNRRWLSL